MNGVVHEIHVTATFVDGRHQALLVSCRPIDSMEVGIVDRIVV